jgi:hypothetical protein
MAMRLAQMSGEVNVDAMLKRMTQSQFIEWCVFFKMEPWGTEREDWRAGMIAATTANCSRGKDTKPYTPKDFMPRSKPTTREIWHKAKMM